MVIRKGDHFILEFKCVVAKMTLDWPLPESCETTEDEIGRTLPLKRLASDCTAIRLKICDNNINTYDKRSLSFVIA